MLCFSGNNGTLSIKTGTFPAYQQKFQGFVVGFQGSKIFCLNHTALNNISTIDVPQSASLHRYLDIKDYENAYKIACLGVTDQDWRALALQALMGLNFTIAKKAFVRIHAGKYLNLLAKFEQMRMQPYEVKLEQRLKVLGSPMTCCSSLRFMHIKEISMKLQICT